MALPGSKDGGAPLPPRARDEGSSRRRDFADYELLEEIGRGGMGVVYRARQKSLKRQVALKMILEGDFANEASRRRFRLEAEAVANLDHPHIVPIYEIGEEGGRHFFSMKMLEGGSLDRRIASLQRDPRASAELMAQVARAVHYAHQRGILHRDLKPANILLDPQGQPHVADFGLAKRVGQDASLTLTHGALGSPNYMAPEQTRVGARELTTAADVYSLGAILYHLFTGRPPFHAETPLETLRRVVEEEVKRPSLMAPALDRDLETICLKCLEKLPPQRYASAEAFADDLERWLRGEAILARPAGPWERGAKWVKRRPALAALFGVIGFAIVVFFVQQSGTQKRLTWERDRAIGQERTATLLRTRAEDIAQTLAIQNAEASLSADNWKAGLSQFARLVRENPSNHVAVERLLFGLTYRNFTPLTVAPLLHKDFVYTSEFSPDGQRILTGSADHTACIWDVQTGRRLVGPLQHEDAIVAARFSPDGRRVVTASKDATAAVWDAQTGERVLPWLRHDNGVVGVDVSPDGRWIATSSLDTYIKLWDAQTGEHVPPALKAGAKIFAVTFSPDGKFLLGAADSQVRVWEVATRQRVGTAVRSDKSIYDAAFSPDGDWFATASFDNKAGIWETKTGRALFPNLYHLYEVFRVRFSPDGQCLASASHDRTAAVWDANSGRRLFSLARHNKLLWGAEFSRDCLRLVTCSDDKAVRMWDLISGEPLAEPMRHDAGVLKAGFSRDGRYVLTSGRDGTARLWNALPGQALPLPIRMNAPVLCVRFSSDGETVVTSGHDLMARLWNAHTGLPIGSPMRHEYAVHCLEFSADNRRLVTADSSGRMRVWDARTGEPIGPGARHGRFINTVQFSADAERVLTSSKDSNACLWRVVSGELAGPILRHSNEVLCARFSPDGRQIATSGRDRVARIWNAETGELLHGLLSHQREVTLVAYSPDGRRLVTASADDTAQAWDTSTGRAVGRSLRHETEVVQASFGPSGRQLLTATSSGIAQLWNAETGEPEGLPMVHDGLIRKAMFSGDGRRIVTASEDKTVRVWDAGTGLPVAGPLRHPDAVLDARFSPDGRRVMTGAEQEGAKIWEVPPPPLPAPAWLPELAEAVVGQRITAQGLFEPVSPARLLELKERSLTSPGDSYYQTWLAWFFADRTTRPVAPGASLTVPEYVERSVQEGSFISLREAVLLCPTNALAFAYLARRHAARDPALYSRTIGTAQYYSRLALQLAPNDERVQQVRAAIQQKYPEKSEDR